MGTRTRSRSRTAATPRFVPATIAELQRVELLAGLPGEKLGEIAKRMEREEVPPGRAVVREGDDAKRFYVVVSGLFAVSQEDLGPRRVLRPGDYFGEVGLAMQVPRTASVRALTPAVVASCDQAAFDELLRPLFAEDA
jgi:ATP-binding cassette, subfamily B, bacterial